VLGAGVAGVTAACVLKKAGMKVKVLEGADRAGGRLRTVPSHFSFPSTAPKHLKGKCIPVDLGGSWIHGVAGSANPIFSLSKLAKCSVVKSHWERAHLFTSDGKRAHRSILIWWLKLMSDITQFFEDEIEDPNMSILEALDEYMALNELGKQDLSAKIMLDGLDSDTESGNDLEQDSIDKSGASSSDDVIGHSEGEETVVIPKDLQKTLTRIALVIAGEWEWAERMEVLSAKRSFEDGDQIGADVMIPNGYWTIFKETIFKDIENDIEYNAEVVKINQKSFSTGASTPSNASSKPFSKSAADISSLLDLKGQKIAVSTADGRVWTTDRVICTLPLGVLKQNVIKFVPELSDQKTVSMARVGFGTMNKIYLQFEEPFWEDQSLWDGENRTMQQQMCDEKHSIDPSSDRATTSHSTASGTTRKCPEIDSHIPPHCIIWMNEKGDGRMTIGVNYNVVVPHSNILCIMATGDAGPEIETMKDEEIIAEIMTTLRKCYEEGEETREKRKELNPSFIASPSQKRRKKPIPNPCNHLITRWGSDKWTGGGAYASLVIGASHDDLTELSRAEGNIYFAGEHTANEGYLGSVHGAYHSGIRAAHQLLSEASIPLPKNPIHPLVDPEPELMEE
jgi:hypothetical protein